MLENSCCEYHWNYFVDCFLVYKLWEAPHWVKVKIIQKETMAYKMNFFGNIKKNVHTFFFIFSKKFSCIHRNP